VTTLVSGQPFDLPIQCYLRGSGTVPAVFNASDTLTAGIVQHGQTAPIFAPTIGWYTKISTQTGYGQGQVQAAGTTAQAALLVPTDSYTLLIWRALSGDSADPELVARIPLTIESLTA
jgi:hypothetical protein